MAGPDPFMTAPLMPCSAMVQQGVITPNVMATESAIMGERHCITLGNRRRYASSWLVKALMIKPLTMFGLIRVFRREFGNNLP